MITILDSITKPAAGDLEGVATLCGSHGGAYAAYLAARTRALAVVLHDAGIGRDHAGIACIDYCEQLGMACATVDYQSARIGNGEDMMARGKISVSNAIASALGVVQGMAVRDAMTLLESAPNWTAEAPSYAEGQCEVKLVDHRPSVLCLDSASMVTAEHAGRILAIGSHGGLLGGNPAAALRTDAYIAMYNDAGIGIDNAGTSRLPALDKRGIAALTVSAQTALIGDGCSTLMDGEISATNRCAQRLGARTGLMAQDWVRSLLASIQ